jgi:hypothetical protein
MIAAEALSHTLEAYLAGSRNALVLEDGAAIFDLTHAKYSLSGEYGKCLLHLWSEERNTVRRVLEAEEKKGMLQLTVQRMGQPRPSKLEICRSLDPRTPTSRKAARAAYQRQLQRMLERTPPEFRMIHITTGANLEQSFGPVYSRGSLRRGQSAFAVFGVNAQESQSSIDGSLTFAILWLDVYRKTRANRLHVEGLKLFVPAGAAELVRARMAHLNQSAAKWRLYAVNEREDSLVELDCRDRRNIETRLVRCPDEAAARERFQAAIEEVRAVLAETEIAILSAGEIAFRHRGLEFARARWVPEPGSFRNRCEVVFGLGAEETTLTDHTRECFVRKVYEIAEVRPAEGPRDHPLFRLHPERWLERLALGRYPGPRQAPGPGLLLQPNARLFRRRPRHD